MAGFIFGGKTGETAESLARKRAIADALLKSSNRMPQNIGEGLMSVGEALAGRFATDRLDKQVAEGRAATTDRFNQILSGYGGDTTTGASSSVAAVLTPDGGEVTPVAGTLANAREGDRQSVPGYAGLDLKGGIKASAEALGISPVDLATAVSYETGGSLDPLQKGPTTKWGQHRGLIQFGEPQAEKYGVNWDDPLNSQLGAEGAVVKYLRDAGVKPGMGLLDIYSAINAGGVGLYDRSDAANGGAPGTVRDKVEQQMADHRARALAMFGDSPSAGNAVDAINMISPTGGSLSDEVAEFRQTPEFMERYPGGYTPQPTTDQAGQGDAGALAYADPASRSSTVAQALASDEIPAEFQGSGQLRNAVGNGRGVIQALLGGDPATDAQVAEARTRGNAVQEALMNPQTVDNGLGIDQRAMDLLSDPYISDGQRATLETFIADKLAERKARREQAMKQADPSYRLEQDKLRLEVDKLRDPKMTPAEQARLDLDTRKFEAEQARGEWELKDGRMVNKRSGEVKELPPSSFKAPAEFKDVTTLRKEIQDLPSYKNLSQALPIYRSMFETAGRDSRASDLNLVYGLGKIMDPTSVVREGEMVMVKNTSSLPDWLQGAIASLNGGAALTPDTREALLTEAYGRVKGYDQAYQQDAGQYRGIVERNRMNIEDVLPSFGTYEPWKPAGKAGAPPEGVEQDVWDAMTPEERKLWQN